jgi:hypothetical protein
MAMVLAVGMISTAAAADKAKKAYNRSDFTDAQKAEIYARALADCRKRHGAQLHNVEINYKYNRVICWSY